MRIEWGEGKIGKYIPRLRCGNEEAEKAFRITRLIIRRQLMLLQEKPMDVQLTEEITERVREQRNVIIHLMQWGVSPRAIKFLRIHRHQRLRLMTIAQTQGLDVQNLQQCCRRRM